MDKVRGWFSDNVIWIVTTLLAIGAFYASMNYTQQALADNIATDKTVHAELYEKINNLEKCIIKLEMMKEDLKEVKSDIKEIKRSLKL